MRENVYAAARRALKHRFIAVALLSAVVNILMLTGPIFMLQVYDRVLSSASIATLQGLFVIVVVLFIFLGIYDFLRTRMLSRAAVTFDQTVGEDAFNLWLKAGADRAKIIGRPLTDLSIVRGFVSSPAIMGFFDLPWVPVYLGIIFIVHPWLGLLAIGGALVVFVLAMLNQFLTKTSLAKAMAMDSKETSFVEQSHLHADTIMPLGMAQHLRGHWAGMHRDGLATGQVGSERGEAFTTSSKAFRLLLQSALLALGGYLAVNQEISAGMIVAASIIAGRALAPIDQVIGQWKAVIRAREADKRLSATFAAMPAVPENVALPDPKGALSVQNVLKYPPGSEGNPDAKPILGGVSFELSAGETLGIIGPSACGKTTLAKILVAAWRPDQGSVRLDGASLSQWDAETLGRHIGYLPQNLGLLAGSIRENIARFDPDATDEAVVMAAQLANAHEMILSLPDGYATQIGYASGPISGGQMQRIGLARALYGMPKLIVLDEPNSNLDAEGDAALARSIQAMATQGSTIVVIAHRPSALAAVSQLIVLKEGRIADFGPKEAVIQRMTRPDLKKPATEARMQRETP
ncbi:MAG: type I secretion system permease/ATPase [Pseudomonadota bacterium]